MILAGWVSDISYVLVGYFLCIMLIGIGYQSKRLIEENKSSVLRLPWLFLRNRGISHKQYQFILIFFIILFYILIVYWRALENTKPVIIGSLLGALPVLIFELNREIRKPHIVLEDVQIIEYPEEWWSFGLEKTNREAQNSIGLHATFRNDGRETAKNCTVRLVSDGVNDQQYHTRWSNQNQLNLELSPNEKQVVDLLWVDLATEIARTAAPNITDSEAHDPPGSYKKTSRPELSADRHSLKVKVLADNMSETEFSISMGGKEQVQMPDDIIHSASEWNVISALKQKSNEPYVIKYHRKRTKSLEIPDTLSDIEYLSRIDDFSEDELNKQPTEPYEAALERRYDVKRF